MKKDTQTFQAVLSNSYELDATPDGSPELSDLTDVKRYDTYPGSYRTENYGMFLLQKFIDTNGIYYNLVYCQQNFPLSPELMAGMDHVEIVSFKRYELVQQIRPIKNYYLYRIIPHTVKGTPAY